MLVVPNLDPIDVFNLYTQKLDKNCDFFWQKPKQGRLHYTDETWFEPHIVGYEAHHIIALSSHKNENTIKDYATTCPESKKKDMFQTLTTAMAPKFKKIAPKPTATVSKGPDCTDVDKQQTSDIDIKDVKENLPNFQLVPIPEFETIDDQLLNKIMDDLAKTIPTEPTDKKK